MNAPMLDLSSLSRATQRLTEGLDRYRQDTSDTQIRDGLIQRFEFTYEISHKMLKRYLEAISPSPGSVDAMAFSDLIRTGSEQGLLLSDWSRWRVFREMRARTSHTYDEQVALAVVAEIPSFLEEAIFLCRQIQSRLN